MGHFRWGVPRKKKKVAQNLLKHALILEFLKSDKKKFRLGGSKNKSCSECVETCSCFGIFEIRQIFFL